MPHTDLPRLAWIGAKMYKQSNGGRKNAPGLSFEYSQAVPENASRTFAAEVEKALKADVQKPDPEASARIDALAEQITPALEDALADKGLYIDREAIAKVQAEMRGE